ncbi:MAG: hypothetical protein HOP17_17720 [Acidobacteria bacterium]|nr:hypothetical protein [Acidobacteriota bacterium]
MAINIIADDARLGERTPVSFPSCISLHVDGGTPLDYFLNRCISLAAMHGGINTLYMIAQASEQVYAGESDGGSGMIFCREHISLPTVSRLAGLAGQVEHIILIICAPMPTPFDVYVSETALSALADNYLKDGDELARLIAVHTGAKVTCAREPRHEATDGYAHAFAGYELQGEGDLVNIGEWDAAVTKYDPEGKLAGEHNYVPGWRDSFGSPSDPRSEL